MEKLRNGHEDSPIKRKGLGEIRGALESLRASIGDLEGEEWSEETPRRRKSTGLGALAAAAALDLVARKLTAEPVRPRRKRPGLGKLAVLAAAVLAVGKLVAARR
ncbi:MAG TPA: hypothetical protein VFS34_00870 [Thermoanaerobaculia bacterium]|nr:hypothetical protein [Thermoanaerobaculia bacterium]